MSNYTLSIALVTRNRPESLHRTLKSLFHQEITPYEVIISDDSKDQEYILRNKQIVKEFGGRYFQGPQQGLYTNRNFAAKNCSGTHIRTMDDDHEFPPGHLRECMKAIRTEPETIWTIGEYSIRSKFHTIPCPIPGQLHPRGFSYIPVNMKNYCGISCGGTIYPARIINEGKLNCEFYKFGIVYLEYGARLKKLGYTIKFIDQTYLIHHDRETTASEMQNKALEEAKLFSIFCFSFNYQRSFFNCCETFLQVIIDIIMRKSSIKIILKALRNYRKFNKFSRLERI